MSLAISGQLYVYQTRVCHGNGLSLAVGAFKKVALLSLYFDSEDGRLLMGMVVGPETLDELLIKFLTCSIPVGNPVVRVVHFLEVVVALVVVVLGIG